MWKMKLSASNCYLICNYYHSFACIVLYFRSTIVAQQHNYYAIHVHFWWSNDTGYPNIIFVMTKSVLIQFNNFFPFGFNRFCCVSCAGIIHKLMFLLIWIEKHSLALTLLRIYCWYRKGYRSQTYVRTQQTQATAIYVMDDNIIYVLGSYSSDFDYSTISTSTSIHPYVQNQTYKFLILLFTSNQRIIAFRKIQLKWAWFIEK